MNETVEAVAKRFTTAIVTGRSMEKIQRFVPVPGMYFAASHGMDIKGPPNKPDITFQPPGAEELMDRIDQVYNELVEALRSTPKAWVEHNKFCTTVHFRKVEKESYEQIAEQILGVLENYPELRWGPGRKVVEIRPRNQLDKGKAVQYLMKSLGLDDSVDVFPIYIGDDRTDEDAFQALLELDQGCSIVVSSRSKKTDASYSLQDPEEVQVFLSRLATVSSC